MRNILFILFIGISSCSERESNRKQESMDDQKTSETVKLTDLNGQPISLEQYKGKTVFVNFWAT